LLDVDLITGDVGAFEFSRASDGTYVDATGVLRTATINAPRFDHDPLTGAPRGLLIERTGTNLLPFSEDMEVVPDWFSNGAMTVGVDAIVGPDGRQAANALVDQDSANCRVGAGAPIPDDTSPYTCSMFVRPSTVTHMRFGCELLGGNPQIQIGLHVDMLSGTGMIFAAVQPEAFGIERHANGWLRIWIAARNNASGNDIALLSAWNDWDTPAQVGEYHAWGAQIEVNHSPTSYISTTGVTGLRAPDQLTKSLPPARDGTLHTIATPAFDHEGTAHVACLQGMPDGRLCIARDGATDRVVLDHGGAPVSGGTWTPGQRRDVIATWSADTVSLYDAATMLETSAPSALAPVTSVGLGGGSALDAHIARVTIWPRPLSGDELTRIPISDDWRATRTD
jgi:hypothetical protein